ncbi:MAG: hypothetical protein JWP12_3491 [Bacteroidetes bacterium]|nr:hypothetical protein [Bacteroidota bacterium]
MKTYISILRGINVGKKQVLMADLKKLYEGLKFKDITTYIQSGNVIFKAETKLSDTALAQKIEEVIFKKYAFEVPVIIRSADELATAIKINPFLKDKKINTEKLHVTFLSDVPEKANTESIKDLTFPPDQFVVLGKEVFIHCPESYGETKLSNKFFENKLKVSATTRNWNTVNKLLEMVVQSSKV